ncbi:twin-arginine translocation signal domain-containing protein [Xylophilus rhododendri]|uniref:Twin-arginine translocation signal domain-containing protein n=1 Tax=Xylophilus rhododendri TaxID=2697032 RepID=A0A857J639_9BURK|nr:TRAP transporter substrate-binding protein [Xylophilus rhododendri]QHI98461.1 twin-arginine translocation signal domain-containing protein [Xylophilus rhododendri]
MPKLTSRRSFIHLAAAGGAAAAMPYASRAWAAPAPIVLRCSGSQPADPSSAHFLWIDRFSSNLKQRVGDRIRVDYFPNGQLGKEADVVQQVRLGSIDMMITGTSIWATALPELALLDMGFVFDSWEHVTRAMNGGVGKAFNDMLLQRTGASFIAYASHYNSRSVYTKAPLANVAGLKGLKLRVLPTPIFIETFKLLGAIPTPIPINELYTAVQTGVVEGFEHDAGTVLSSKFNEVVKHCLLTEHLFSPVCTSIGKRAMAKIPPELRAAFQESADEASRYQREMALSKGTEALATLKAQRMNFVEVPAADRKLLRDRMQADLWPSVIKQYPATQPIMDIINKTRA